MYQNPYTDLSFGEFFWQLILRLSQFLQGKLAFHQMASDEIQIAVLCGIAASSALVGTFLVLRKMTMLANSISHTILAGIVVAYIIFPDSHGHGGEGVLNIQAMLAAALAMGVLTAFLTEFLTKVARLQEDASTGIVFTTLFSIGIILVTLLTRNAHIGTEAVMGNVDALHINDCKLVYAILLGNLFLCFLFFKEYKITAFDSGLARALGISPVFYNYLLMTQVSATSIGAFRAVGVLMVLAFLTGPVLTARLLTDRLGSMLGYAVGIGCLASVIGVALARHILTIYGAALSTAGLVVCVIVALFVIVQARKLFQVS